MLEVIYSFIKDALRWAKKDLRHAVILVLIIACLIAYIPRITHLITFLEQQYTGNAWERVLTKGVKAELKAKAIAIKDNYGLKEFIFTLTSYKDGAWEVLYTTDESAAKKAGFQTGTKGIAGGYLAREMVLYSVNQCFSVIPSEWKPDDDIPKDYQVIADSITFNNRKVGVIAIIASPRIFDCAESDDGDCKYVTTDSAKLYGAICSALSDYAQKLSQVAFSR